jgi:hypothetical protein
MCSKFKEPETMEINITHLMNDESFAPFEFSASVAERGGNAGRETWANAVEYAADAPLLTLELCSGYKIETLDDVHRTARDYLAEFGAWDADEIAGWTVDELNAIVLQLICGDIRERAAFADDPDELAEYEESNGGHIYQGDTEDDPGFGLWFYYLGS